MVGFGHTNIICVASIYHYEPGWSPVRELVAPADAYSQIELRDRLQLPRHFESQFLYQTINLKVIFIGIKLY